MMLYNDLWKIEKIAKTDHFSVLGIDLPCIPAAFPAAFPAFLQHSRYSCSIPAAFPRECCVRHSYGNATAFLRHSCSIPSIPAAFPRHSCGILKNAAEMPRHRNAAAFPRHSHENAGCILTALPRHSHRNAVIVLPEKFIKYIFIII